jgi:hypothetical protein
VHPSIFSVFPSADQTRARFPVLRLYLRECKKHSGGEDLNVQAPINSKSRITGRALGVQWDIRMGKLFRILMAILFTASAHALDCEPLYRSAYLEYAKHGKPDLRETADLYLMHFDASNGIAEVYAEARPLFSALKTTPAQDDQVLGVLTSKMKNGELCPHGEPLTINQTADVLRSALKN